MIAHKIYGWSFEQWARVLAIYPDEPKKEISDFLRIRNLWRKGHPYQPEAKTPIIGAEPKYDYCSADRLFNIGFGGIGG